MTGARGAVRAIALVALAAAVHPARADDFTLPFQVRDQGGARQLVVEFERSAQEGKWAVAADHLQQLLDLPAGDAIVIRAKGFVPARFEGAGVVARRLFDALPPAGRAAWEANSRERAEQLLGRGLRLRREQDLRDCARRYPAPDVRRRAHHALAELALVRGDLASAQFQLEALLGACEPAERADALARLAWVSAQLADPERVAWVRRDAAALASAPVRSGEGTEPLGDFVDRMSRLASAGAAAARARQFGGDAHGTGVREAPTEPESVQWSIDTEFEEGQENNEDYSHLEARDKYRLTPAVPVVSHGLVFVNNGLRVTAFNLSSGTEVWRRDTTLRPPVADWRDSFVATHTVAVADGVVYAAIAAPSIAGAMGDRHAFGRTILYPLPHRILYALDERTGDVLWCHETAFLGDRDDAGEIRRESVSSPPLVVGEDLIVSTWAYEGIFDARLVCYDRRTGRTRWRTSLAQGQQELNLFGRPVKELSTGPVAELGNRVFVCTGLGVAAAVEREDGRVAWLSAYPQTRIPSAYQWWQTIDRKVTWFPSTLAATPDGVVMAPLDGSSLVCLDPATGRTLWSKLWSDPSDSRRDAYRWFLGVSRGRAFVAGSRAMAIDVKSGSFLWTDADAGRLVPAKAQPADAAGAGILTPERLYVPTSRGIAVISTATGALEASWALPTSGAGSAPVTGSLAEGDGALLFVQRMQVHASYRVEELGARLTARLEESPEDPQVHLEAGEAFAAAGRLDLAIATLRKGLPLVGRLAARVRDRVESGLRRSLYSALLARAAVRAETSDAGGAAKDLADAADCAGDRGDAVRALFRLSATLAEANRREEGDAALRRVATEFSDVVTATEDGERASAGALALFRLAESRFAAGRTADAVAQWLEVMEQRGREDLGDSDVATAVRRRLEEAARTEPALVRGAVHERARKAFLAAKASGDVALLDRTSRLYPDPEFAAESAILAADMHLAAKRPREAVGVLTALLAAERPPGARARALWRLAAAYRALGETARERAQLRRLASETPGEIVEGSLRAADAAARELEAPRFREAGALLPDPKPPLSLLWQAGGPDKIPPQTLRLPGGSPPELEGRMVLAQAGVVQLVEEATGRVVWEQATHVEVRAAAASPGVLTIAGSDTGGGERAVVVLSLSTADGRELWPRRRFTGQYRVAETSLGVMYLLYVESGVPGQRASYAIAAVSTSSEDVIATRSFGGGLQPQLTVAEDAVVVVEPTRGGGSARRALLVLDGTTLALQGRLDLATPSSPFALHPPSSGVFVTTDGGAIVALDLRKGDAAWKAALAGGAGVKNMFAVPGGVIVSDDGDGVRRLDAASGREIWRTPLASLGNLVFSGEAAEGGVVVATVRRPRSASAVVVALDAATGAEIWRAPLPLADENGSIHPQILASSVSVEINERLDDNRVNRSRVMLFDRSSGRLLQEVEHPTIGRTFQAVWYGAGWLAVSNANEIAVYGRRTGAK